MNHLMKMPVVSARQEQSLRRLTLVIYVLYGLSLVTALPAVFALLLNYMRLSESRGTIYHSHLRWVLRSFWWGMVWMALGWGMLALGLRTEDYGPGDFLWQATDLAGLGTLVLVLNWIWLVSRVMRGLLYWSEHRRMWY